MSTDKKIASKQNKLCVLQLVSRLCWLEFNYIRSKNWEPNTYAFNVASGPVFSPTGYHACSIFISVTVKKILGVISLQVATDAISACLPWWWCHYMDDDSGGFDCNNEYFVLLAMWRILLLPQDLQDSRHLYCGFRVAYSEGFVIGSLRLIWLADRVWFLEIPVA